MTVFGGNPYDDMARWEASGITSQHISRFLRLVGRTVIDDEDVRAELIELAREIGVSEEELSALNDQLLRERFDS